MSRNLRVHRAAPPREPDLSLDVDALEFPDGQIVLLTSLCQGQQATVLQLPVAPRTPEEAEVERLTRLVHLADAEGVVLTVGPLSRDRV